MKLGEVRKVIYFNLNKPDQRALYEFAETIDFGKEVKAFLSEKLKQHKALQAHHGESADK